MIAPLWVVDLATRFWAEAKESELFPRNLRRPASRALKIGIVLLPKLTILSMIRWLDENGVSCNVGRGNRRLRACLVARGGFGFVFLDGSDPDEEQRFSLAHEIAHFLREYWFPRRSALQLLGAEAIEILDGQRPPTQDERLCSLLRGISIGFHLHLMERDFGGRPKTAAIAEAEEHADRLAFELLAPVEHVGCTAAGLGRSHLQVTLRERYGLPDVQADTYARILLPSLEADPLLLRLKGQSSH